MPSLARCAARAFVGFRYAALPDLDPFYYSIDVLAWGVPRGLKWRAVRLLQTFGVLVRAGEYGFVGVRAPMWALARFAGQVVSGSASVDTVRRALRELEADGWISRAYYGGGQPRELTDDQGAPYWVRDQVPVITFTRKLLELFSGAAGRSCRTSSYGSQNAGVTIGTLDPALQESPRAGARDRLVEVTAGQFEAVPGPSLGPGALDRGESLPPTAPGSVPLSAPTPSQPTAEKSTFRAKRPTPRELRGARPFVRSATARALLEVLARVAESRGRAGRAATARAALELSDPAAAARSLVNWDFWLTRWGDMTRSERRRVCRAEILPGLLAGVSAGGPVLVGLPAPPREPEAFEAPPGPRATDEEIAAAMVDQAMDGNSFAAAWCRERGLSW